MPYYIMTDKDRDDMRPKDYEENFSRYDHLNDALITAEAELTVDYDDTTYKSCIVNELGQLVAERWMDDGLKRRDYAPGATLSWQERKINEQKRYLEFMIGYYREEMQSQIDNSDLPSPPIDDVNQHIENARNALEFFVKKAGG